MADGCGRCAGCTVIVPPVPFIAGDPTASPFWPDDKMTGRAAVDDPLPEDAQPIAEDVVIGAPDAAPGSPDYCSILARAARTRAPAVG